ncbi:VIT1/CCC1 transporter family protein [Novosphingobium sp. PhB165]|uniref:VIT1/CCC1 transporter family protein n=1 Tax=Novosphingobium sp. PhB165 TaxID=2485105 RepID=UPI001A9E4827|nr:VIT1/CCC1 transporter family protein [Novosphingobium sp. PhB165]
MSELRQYLQDRKSRRTWSLAARDGIIATAGILLGFTGAGAGDRTLMLAATAATVAGVLAAGGAEWSEAASEREAQLNALEVEIAELQKQKSVQEAEIVEYYRKKGLSQDLAVRVASELIVRSPLKTAMESEHGILKLTSQAEVVLTGVSAAIAYFLGAAIPLVMTFFLPVDIEAEVIFVAALVSLTFISFIGARVGDMDVSRNVIRTLVVGVGTIAISYAVGEIAF